MLESQSYYEFWVVATRPVLSNGLGMSPATAAEQLSQLDGLFVHLREVSELCGRWRQLVVEYDVRGKSAHAARLVAAMNLAAITHLGTFNDADFGRYRDITIMHPDRLAAEVAS